MAAKQKVGKPAKRQQTSTGTHTPVSTVNDSVSDNVSDNRAITSDDAAEAASDKVNKLRDEIQNLRCTVNTLQQVGFLLTFVDASYCNPTTIVLVMLSRVLVTVILHLLRRCPVWRMMGPETDSDTPSSSSLSFAKLLLQLSMWTYTAVN